MRSPFLLGQEIPRVISTRLTFHPFITLMTKQKQLTEEELLNRLLSGEHQFVERKPQVNQWDIKQNAVAFANTVKWPREGVLFIGVNDKTGKPTGRLPEDLGKAQQDIRGHLDQCYPPIPYYMTLVPVDGQQVIAVVVTESTQTPHFTGKAYVRVGDSTIGASEEKIQELVENRLSDVWELRKWVGRTVTVSSQFRSHKELRRGGSIPSIRYSDGEEIIEEVSRFYIVLKSLSSSEKWSVTLEQVTISWDTEKDRLRLILKGLS